MAKTDHERVNDILLGPLERPALQWLAAHMPDWVTPDILTIVGVFGSVVILAGYALTEVDAALQAGGKSTAEIGTQTGADIGAGLEDAAEGAAAAAGAEGGLNPFADIGAAILGLASILGVTFGGKHAVHEADPEFIPSAQFGI